MILTVKGHLMCCVHIWSESCVCVWEGEVEVPKLCYM